MTKKLKKALALLMALSMLTVVLGTATFAADEGEPTTPLVEETEGEPITPPVEETEGEPTTPPVEETEGEPTMPPDEESNADENIAPAAEEAGEPRESQAPETEIPEESEGLGENDTPLAEVPQTGDMLWLWLLLTASSAAGLVWLFLGEKKGKRVA